MKSVTKNAERGTVRARVIAGISMEALGVGRMVLLGGLSFCVLGCRVQAPASQLDKVDAPQKWSSGGSKMSDTQGVDSDWVKSFGDAALNQLVAEALANNADMQVMAERVKQARRAAYVAGADGRPTMAAEFRGDRSKRQFVGLPFGGSAVDNGSYADLRVSWEPDLWGRVRVGQSAALADAQSVAMDAEAAQASLAAEVCKAWFALGAASEQLAIAEALAENHQQTEEVLRARYAQNLVGDGGSAAQLRATQAELATSRALLAQRKSEVQLAQHRLELLCGRYPAGKVKGRARLAALPKRTPSGLPSTLLQRRPDVCAAERSYASAISRVKEAKRAVFPIVTLTSSGGTASDALESILDTQFSTWAIGAKVTQNLLTGGRVRGELKIRQSKEQEALARFRGVVLKAFGEVENGLVLEGVLRERVEAFGAAYQQLQESAEAAQEEYEKGVGSSLEVLATQKRAQEMKAQWVSLRQNQLENRVNLHLALGGNFKSK